VVCNSFSRNNFPYFPNKHKLPIFQRSSSQPLSNELLCTIGAAHTLQGVRGKVVQWQVVVWCGDGGAGVGSVV